nr:UDP-2,4-diacetamido-2,4,6-trideoxy-beta-L-altropyranose hydrolase [uncultured Moraxella sp.]
MKFVIRADASLQIGSGHIMRCLTLANALKKNEHEVTFICREHDGHLIDFFNNQNINVEILAKPKNQNFTKNYAHSEWLGVSETDDFAECLPILQKIQPNWLIIDHYAIAKNWQTLARQHFPNVKILQIDDLADREHDCDILLDQTFGRKNDDYQSLVPKNCQLLLGCRFALLRDEFANWREFSLGRRQKISKIKTILINLGGVDKDNITLKVLQNLAEYCQKTEQNFNITVVMGKTAPHTPSVQDFAKQMPNCHVLIGADNMAELMANADMAIGAGGSTSWERCCLGVPALLLVLADNQSYLANVLHEKNAVVALLDLQNFEQDFLAKLQDLQQTFVKISQNCQKVVDGFGAKRVANYLDLSVKYQQNFAKISVRLATVNDLITVWQWRNHEEVRKFMFGQDEIALSDHKKWFNKQLSLSNVTLLIFELNQQPIGFVNFTRLTVDKYQTLNNSVKSKNALATNKASWGFYLSPDCPKGQGLGFLLGVLAIGFIFNQTNTLYQKPPQAITAQVLAYNQASLALHRKLGFVEKDVLKQYFSVNNQTYDVFEFELTSEQFLF